MKDSKFAYFKKKILSYIDTLIHNEKVDDKRIEKSFSDYQWEKIEHTLRGHYGNTKL